MAKRKWKTTSKSAQGQSAIDPAEMAKPAVELTPDQKRQVSLKLTPQPVIETTEREATPKEVVSSIRKARKKAGVTQSGSVRKKAQPKGSAKPKTKKEVQAEAVATAIEETVTSAGDAFGKVVARIGAERNETPDVETGRTSEVDEPNTEVNTTVGEFDNPADIEVTRDAPRNRSNPEAGPTPKTKLQRQTERRARVEYSKRRRRGGVLLPAAPDIPTDLRGAAARQRLFGVGTTVDREGNVVDQSRGLVTSNPPVERVPVPDPTKKHGIGSELRPVPTPLTRRSIFDTYVRPAQTVLDDVLAAKQVAESVTALDIKRASEERVFNPETNKPEVSTEVTEAPEGGLRWSTITKRRTGTNSVPSRRQVLRNIADENPESYRALRGALSVGIQRAVGVPKSVSRILDAHGDTSMSQEFLDNVRGIAEEAKRIQELAATEEGRRTLIQEGTRFGNVRGAVGGVLPQKGGLQDLSGYELKDLLDEEDYQREVEAAAKSSVGAEVKPTGTERGSSRIQSTVTPATVPGEVISTTDIPSGRDTGIPGGGFGPNVNFQEILDRYLDDAESRGQLEEAKKALLSGSFKSIPPISKQAEKTTPEVDASGADTGRTIREATTENFQPGAQARKALAEDARAFAAKVAEDTGTEVNPNSNLSTAQLGRYTSAKEARIVSAEDRTREEIEAEMKAPPGGAQSRQLRSASVLPKGTVPGNPNLRFNELGGIQHVVGTSDKELARAAAAGDPHALMFLSGGLDPISILPGGKFGPIGGEVRLPRPAHPLHHLLDATDEEREAYRVAAFARPDVRTRPTAPKVLPPSVLEPVVRARQKASDAVAFVTGRMPHVKDVMSGRERVGTDTSGFTRIQKELGPERAERSIIESSIEEAGIVGGPLAHMGTMFANHIGDDLPENMIDTGRTRPANPSVYGWNPPYREKILEKRPPKQQFIHDHYNRIEGDDPAPPMKRQDLAVVRDLSTMRRGGTMGIILPSSHVKTYDKETGQWGRMRKEDYDKQVAEEAARDKESAEAMGKVQIDRIPGMSSGKQFQILQNIARNNI